MEFKVAVRWVNEGHYTAEAESLEEAIAKVDQFTRINKEAYGPSYRLDLERTKLLNKE